MRWPAFFILVYVAVGLQIGMGDFVRIGGSGARPDLVMLAVIFIAIHAPRDAALLGAFGIGLVQDLVSLSPLGLYALAYALVAIHVWTRGPAGISVMDLLTSALYTAFLAPIILGLLNLTRKAFAFSA